MQRRPRLAHGGKHQLLGRRLLATASSPGSVLHRRFLSSATPRILSGRLEPPPQLSTVTGTSPCGRSKGEGVQRRRGRGRSKGECVQRRRGRGRSKGEGEA